MNIFYFYSEYQQEKFSAKFSLLFYTEQKAVRVALWVMEKQEAEVSHGVGFTGAAAIHLLVHFGSTTKRKCQHSIQLFRRRCFRALNHSE